jgi:hypothetical protein
MSEYSHKEKNKITKIKDPTKKHKKSVNQVEVSNNNITISAGPLYFQKIVNKMRSD